MVLLRAWEQFLAKTVVVLFNSQLNLARNRVWDQQSVLNEQRNWGKGGNTASTQGAWEVWHLSHSTWVNSKAEPARGSGRCHLWSSIIRFN